MAAVLACGDGAVLSHRDAAALHDLRPVGSGKIDVTAPDRHSLPGIRCHWARTLDAADGTVEVMYLSEDPAVNSWVIGLRGHDTVLAIVFVPLALGACLALVIGIKAARSSPGAFRRWLAERYYR